MSFRDQDVEKKSDKLSQKRIAFGVCAGIGAVEVVKIIRELRRHGAEVTCFITPTVTEFVGRTSLEWASARPVVEALTANVDGLEPYDLVVVAPVTLNTLVKISLGLCDNPVTMVAASQLGRKQPMILFPTMHASLAAHPEFTPAVEKLASWGVKVALPETEEGRFKMPSREKVAELVLEQLNTWK